MPPPAQTKPAAIAEASPVATPASFKSGTLPAAIAPLSTRNAALAGDPAAANIVGERYLSGKGVARNPKLAQHWLEVAANGGSAAAEFRLGVMFEKGDDGLPADRNQATTWYRKSAEHGNVQAMHNLAVLYAGQTEGTPDYATAAKWFEQAANYGLKDSQYNLAVLYQSGLGVTKDAATAYKWFAIGAAHGDTEAAKQRDDLRKTIPAGTLASLEPQIKAWHAKPQPRPSSAADAQSSPATQVLVKPPETAASEVGDVQQMLVKLGYDPGTLDGTMTAQTREAIRTFEQRSGLPDNGEISDELLSKLKGLAG